MTASCRRSSLLLLALFAGSLQAAPAETPHQAECAVWQRELSFARSVADHDAVVEAVDAGMGHMEIGEDAGLASGVALHR